MAGEHLCSAVEDAVSASDVWEFMAGASTHRTLRSSSMIDPRGEGFEEIGLSGCIRTR